MAKRGAPVTVNWSLMDDDWCCGVKSLQGIADSYEEKTGQKEFPSRIQGTHPLTQNFLLIQPRSLVS